jgi:epoxyqueuosine reductase
MNKEIITLTQRIKAEAHRLGFAACGVAQASAVTTDEQVYYNNWINRKQQASMDYLTRNVDKRNDPRLLVEGTESIVCVALNYYPKQRIAANQYQMAYYSYGKDYHDVMKAKLRELFQRINETIIPVEGRIFCDTAPVLERYWAQQAGLGWIGKNTQLIIPGMGSYFFLGELFLNVELDYDTPIENRCGTCEACLKHCPTQALERPYHLNANKCLSYLTIEHRGEIPEQQQAEIKDSIYGCDECQKYCPWNRFAEPTDITEFTPSNDLLQMKPNDWKQLSKEKYQQLFKGSAVKRAKYEGLLRNIEALKKKNEDSL